MANNKDTPKDLNSLVAEYLDWAAKRAKAEEQLSVLKEQIIALAQSQKIKKINFDKTRLLIVAQTETRFPQIGEPGRKEVEKIIKESGEAKEAMVFDIISLGNLYDQKKLSAALMARLAPFAKKTKSTKIVIRSVKAS